MGGDTTALLVCMGSVVVMVLYWTYYIRSVRKTPRSERWYDSADSEGGVSDGPLFIYPYGTLLMGAVGLTGLIADIGLPEPAETVLMVPCMVAFVIAAIGFTGAFGIPLPWPFVPRWAVDIRRAKRARRRERREARRKEKKG